MCIITCRILEHIYLHLQPSPIIPSNFLESAQLFHARRLAQSSIGLHKDHRSLRHFLYYFASLLRTRSEEHTPELKSLLRSTYAVICVTTKQQESNHRSSLSQS